MRTASTPTPALLLLGALLAGCSDEAPVTVTPGNLAMFTAQFQDRPVRVTGVLCTHDDPRHYWIEDDRLNRVALVDVGDLSARVGERVTVRGRFLFDRTAGRRIEVEALTAAPPAGADARG